jgi:hypothetical protein
LAYIQKRLQNQNNILQEPPRVTDLTGRKG